MEKAYTLALLAWIVLACIGYLSGFAASEVVIRYSPYACVPLGIAFFLPWQFDRHPDNPRLSQDFLRRSFVSLVGFAFFIAIAWFGLLFGAPLAFTTAVGVPYTAEFKVVGKGDGRFHWRAGCDDHFVRVKNANQGIESRICSKSLWLAVETNQTIILRGKSSALGVAPSEVPRGDG